MPATDAAAYSASKAALLSLGKSVSLEYAAQGVRVITVSPSPTATPMGLGDDGVARQVAASIPIKRFLRHEEIADTICFLAAVRASGITGTEVVVDGGLTATMWEPGRFEIRTVRGTIGSFAAEGCSNGGRGGRLPPEVDLLPPHPRSDDLAPSWFMG